MKTTLALAATLVAASNAVAQDARASAPAAASTASARAIPSTDEVSLHPGADYPAELVKAGVQGSVVVLVTIGAEGNPADATIQQTSRSAPLDDAALAYVRSAIRLGSAAHPAPPQVLVPLRFTKDSLRTLADKTCADFAVDATWFRATFPEKTLRDMPVVNMSVGALVLKQPMASARMMAIARHSNAAEADATLAACTAHPDDRFLATLSRVVDDAVAKDR